MRSVHTTRKQPVRSVNLPGRPVSIEEDLHRQLALHYSEIGQLHERSAYVIAYLHTVRTEYILRIHGALGCGVIIPAL